ncbi:glycoprotein 3-alpha-L-fucosyltransferase A-like [Physella acuta]|uniref:glycoprotein 3-alpha-L-fucosyltransferase A-like n=1 Tax=Physella acuta TaxID=109671 RepID=UPI0027DB0789|nr:glycoprotein 3-alpha-L-fucosyltransferase A-like [Physella acuta]
MAEANTKMAGSTVRVDGYRATSKFTKRSVECLNIFSGACEAKEQDGFVKYVDVDIFGRCSNTSLCRQPNTSADCLTPELNKYKFYLSFENSFCKDYFTEKLLRLFLPNINVVPVVRGGADYDRSIPENTFINADSFKTAKDLAMFLKNLSSDVERYSDILRAKDQYRFLRTPNFYCTICNKLRNASIKPKVYDSKAWLEEQCRDPKKFK